MLYTSRPQLPALAGAAWLLLNPALSRKGSAAPANAPAKPGIAWRSDLNAALAVAKRQEKPVLVYFHASWCGPCHALEKQVLSQLQVVRATRAAVPVKVDLDAAPETAARYGVQKPPTLILLSPGGGVLKQVEGYVTAGQLVELLRPSGKATTYRLQKNPKGTP